CVDTEAMVHRIRRRAIRENRVDDAHEDIIRKRFQVYESETKPVLEYYPSKLVADVDAFGSPAEVLFNILKHVVPVQNAHFRQEAVPLLENYLQRFSSRAVQARLKLAKILIEQQQRPTYASRILAELPRQGLAEKEEKLRTSLTAKAQKMIDDGVLELEGRAW